MRKELDSFFLEVQNNTKSFLLEDLSYKTLKTNKRIVLLCSADFMKISAFLEIVSRINPDLEIIFCGQPSVEQRLKNYLKRDIEFIAWKGKFCDQTAELIIDNITTKDVDALIFVNLVIMNSRDINLLSMAEIISCKKGIKAYDFTKDEKLYEIVDVHKYKESLVFFENLIHWTKEVLV